MEFQSYCPSCGQKLKAEQEHAGRTVGCPHCGVEFRVSQPEPELPSAETIAGPIPMSRKMSVINPRGNEGMRVLTV
jgi:DNA-directed RNA polymerase subunit M/transcription elongation factor TFIIS